MQQTQTCLKCFVFNCAAQETHLWIIGVEEPSCAAEVPVGWGCFLWCLQHERKMQIEICDRDVFQLACEEC